MIATGNPLAACGSGRDNDRYNRAGCAMDNRLGAGSRHTKDRTSDRCLRTIQRQFRRSIDRLRPPGDRGFQSGVEGNVVTYLVGDHQNSTDIALNIVREWFDRGDVDAVLELAQFIGMRSPAHVSEQQRHRTGAEYALHTEGQSASELWCGDRRPHGEVVLAEHGALDLRQLDAHASLVHRDHAGWLQNLRPKSSGDRAYHERRLTTREIAFGAVSRRRRRRHSAANWSEVAGPGRGVVIARLVLADGQ
jgi:hypothetical protein